MGLLDIGSEGGRVFDNLSDAPALNLGQADPSPGRQFDNEGRANVIDADPSTAKTEAAIITGQSNDAIQQATNLLQNAKAGGRAIPSGIYDAGEVIAALTGDPSNQLGGGAGGFGVLAIVIAGLAILAAAAEAVS